MPKTTLFECFICGSKFLEEEHKFKFTAEGSEYLLHIQSEFNFTGEFRRDYICRSCLKTIVEEGKR